jgi:prophage regulatory protein
MTCAILRLPTVKARTGLSRSTLYLRIAEGRFPAPVSLGGRAVGWIDTEIDAWLAERVAASREGGARERERRNPPDRPAPCTTPLQSNLSEVRS